MKISGVLLILCIILSACSTFTRVEITDELYIRIPDKPAECLKISEHHEVYYSGGIQYCFTDTSSGAQVIIANHPYTTPYFTKHLPYILRCIQANSDMQQHVFTWEGISPELHRADSEIEKYDIDSRTIYWKAMLVARPKFAPDCDWYFIGFDNVPKNELRLYKQIFRLRKKVLSQKRQSPWAPLFNSDQINIIHKSLNE